MSKYKTIKDRFLNRIAREQANDEVSQTASEPEVAKEPVKKKTVKKKAATKSKD